MPKAELIARARYTCRHRHNGLSHHQCYSEQFPAERVGYLDIEATSLNASFGFMLAYCIKRHGGETLQRCITPKEISTLAFDKRLCVQFLEDVKQFDRLITYYGTGYDVPFLRTRCLSHDLGFPPMGTIWHTDAYYQVRHKLKLHSNRLEAACTFFGIPSKGTKLDPGIWRDAQAGSTKALSLVLRHNVEDVCALEGLWNIISGHSKINKRSI